MASGIGEVVVDTDALAVLVEDVGHTAGKEAKGSLGDLEGLADLIALIGKDGEVEAKLGGELLLRFNILSRDANDICMFGVKYVGRRSQGSVRKCMRCPRNDP